MALRYIFLAGAIAAAPQAALAEVIVSPRVSYFFDNINQRSSGLDEAATPDAEAFQVQTDILQDLFGPTAGVSYESDGSGVNNDQIALPMYGIAVSVIKDDWSFTATGMYGESNVTIRTNASGILTTTALGLEATDILTFSSIGEGKSKRVDLELTAQKRINERFAVMGGVRYEGVDQAVDAIANLSLSNNQQNLVAALTGGDLALLLTQATTPLIIDGKYRVYSIRGGVAGFIPFGQRNAVFLNGMLHLSHEPSTLFRVAQTDFITDQLVTTESRGRAETTLGPDMSVGLQIGLSESVNFDIRYRGTFYFPVAGSATFEDVRVNHGINAGVSFRF